MGLSLPRKQADSQTERFREAARELGAEVPEEDFDRVLRRVAKPTRGSKPAPKKLGPRRRKPAGP